MVPGIFTNLGRSRSAKCADSLAQTGNFTGSRTPMNHFLAGGPVQNRCGLLQSLTGLIHVIVGNGQTDSFDAVFDPGFDHSVTAAGLEALTMPFECGLMISQKKILLTGIKRTGWPGLTMYTTFLKKEFFMQVDYRLSSDFFQEC